MKKRERQKKGREWEKRGTKETKGEWGKIEQEGKNGSERRKEMEKGGGRLQEMKRKWREKEREVLALERKRKRIAWERKGERITFKSKE
jgi:hypothetical protein